MTSPEQFPSVCQPVEAALRQQVEQERLLNQVTTQIRQSLELPVILETAVQKVRHLLAVDRLVIYQFQLPTGTTLPDQASVEDPSSPLITSALHGCVTYEALASNAISSILGYGEREHCFTDPQKGKTWHPNGVTFAVQDVELSYQSIPCLLQQMRQNRVRSKLVSPIRIQNQLWGLLIAHQCSSARDWLPQEQNFLSHIAEHLAIAIYQAELYAQLQQQKQTLEQQVITRTRDLRDTLLASQAADRAKSEFIANVSHEFRSPLTTVIGMSATLLHWTVGNLSARQRHYLQTIHDSGKHLLELINDVLDLSQLESGKMVLKVREFSLALLAKQTLDSFRDAAANSQIDLKLIIGNAARTEPQPSMTEDLLFLADRRRVRQILLNLLSNAVKFTPMGGQVTLRVWIDQGKAFLQVEDTGIGIAPDDIPLLFQKFHQLDASYDREFPGTGLGLALTKQLVELHNGRIEVQSTPHIGSQFTVSLPPQAMRPPASTATPSSALSSPSSPSSLRTAQIVLIESNEHLAQDLCQVLTHAGYHVIWIMEGVGAISQVQLLQPEVVVVSMQLARTNGHELIQKLRELPQGKALKILALHSPANLDSSTQHILNYADDELYQPIVSSEFISKIEDLLTSLRSQAPNP